MTPESGLAALLLFLGLGGRPGDKPVTLDIARGGTGVELCAPGLPRAMSSPRAIRAPRVGEP